MPTEELPEFTEPLLGVVFDLDGTLILSHHDFPKMRREAIRSAEKHGVLPGTLSPSQPIFRIVESARRALAAAGVAEGELDRMEAEIHSLHDQIELESLPGTRIRPGAEPLLRSLHARGYRLGLLTRSADPFCHGALAKTGLAPFFGWVRTRSSPGPAKPAPEALTTLLGEMEVPRARALFVGDHPMDAECSVGAGVRFVGILPDAPSEEDLDGLRKAGAAVVVRDLDDLAALLKVPSTGKPAAPPAS